MMEYGHRKLHGDFTRCKGIPGMHINLYTVETQCKGSGGCKYVSLLHKVGR